MGTDLSGNGLLVLIIFLCTAFLSLWKKVITRDLVFFGGALLTSLTGVIPAKFLLNGIANPAILILIMQQILSRWILPKLKWRHLLAAMVFAPFLDHERLLLSFRSRFLPVAFVIALGGCVSWFGSPINLAVWHLAKFPIDSLKIATIGGVVAGIGLIYSFFIPEKLKPIPMGNAIIPLGSPWTKKGKKEGEVIQCHDFSKAGDILLLEKGKDTFFQGIRWYPILLLISGFIFVSAIQQSGLATWIEIKIASYNDYSPLLIKTILVLAVFGLCHLFPNIIVVSFFSLFMDPYLLIVTASCAFLSKTANDVNLLAFGLGNYQNRDYLKFGLPLSLICLITELIWTL